MLLLVTYDVSTETKEGKRRLRKVARACQAYGQRVQKSVFECQVNQMQYEALEAELLKIICKKEDSVRLYRLRQRALDVTEHGNVRAVDFEDALIL
jgi:CRISPR-associated protein Cas2